MQPRASSSSGSVIRDAPKKLANAVYRFVRRWNRDLAKPFECEQAMTAIFKYMEVFYNTKRLHSALDYVSPANYEQQQQVALARAA